MAVYSVQSTQHTYHLILIILSSNVWDPHK